ncbi:LysR family transcriptional regulator [Chroococcidiopsis sp. CCALA 051]|uniref:LysR family transcriptional regulator n=1 Tax=Chroococcidiopsis sp. CCALA 051 TaxID=869949 RepID=UPI000D0D6974|nr:LysR family transcriptional regulator [Chroococcidiopsis sp. CCALA 051]MBE9014637.1 LysR family transcriptional regulator [Chroococcidiopsidales cyanobacterium LEGE 13417]PSM47545.1 LysR family transcriptional regulator [Chroococcidiopsis sp. CCALA 051]
MDFSVLQIFVEVMRQGSFAAVARDRNIDPSSVSRAIAGLEEELGIRLLQRTTRQLSPTEAGMAYFQRIEPLVEEMQQAIDIATDVTGQPKGTLRVTASVSFGLKCIVPLLSSFSVMYPDLTVDLLLTDAIVDLLAERIDVAVRLGPLADSTLIAQQLMRTRYSVCASPDYLKRWGQPQKLSDVEQHNCLLFPLAGFRSRWIFMDKNGDKSEIPVRGRVVISSAIALQQCAIAGMGLALLPHWLIDEDLNNGKLVNVFPDYQVTATDFNTAAWLIYPSRAYVPLKVRVFIDFLKKHISS